MPPRLLLPLLSPYSAPDFQHPGWRCDGERQGRVAAGAESPAPGCSVAASVDTVTPPSAICQGGSVCVLRPGGGTPQPQVPTARRTKPPVHIPRLWIRRTRDLNRHQLTGEKPLRSTWQKAGNEGGRRSAVGWAGRRRLHPFAQRARLLPARSPSRSGSAQESGYVCSGWRTFLPSLSLRTYRGRLPALGFAAFSQPDVHVRDTIRTCMSSGE